MQRVHPLAYLLTVGDDILKLNASLHRCPGIEAEARRKCGGSHPGLRVGLEQPPVEVVGDLPAVLHLAHLRQTKDQTDPRRGKLVKPFKQLQRSREVVSVLFVLVSLSPEN